MFTANYEGNETMSEVQLLPKNVGITVHNSFRPMNARNLKSYAVHEFIADQVIFIHIMDMKMSLATYFLKNCKADFDNKFFTEIKNTTTSRA